MAVSVRNVEDMGEYNSVFTILLKGKIIHYVTPSFPVYSVEFSRGKVPREDENESLLVFDTFARKCDMLDHQLPAVAEILFNYDNAFIVEVCYKGVYTVT